MIDVRPFDSLGRFQNDWLNARHHFSFGHYHDDARMGLGALRVWNDDAIAPHTGFDLHPHRDMEIITYVRSGAITHVDNLGNTGRTEAGDVQVMHAGSGITHGEYNHEDAETRIFQIWLMPNKRGVEPGWEARAFPASGAGLRRSPRAMGGLARWLSTPTGPCWRGVLPGETVRHSLPPGVAAYLVPAAGRVIVNGAAVGTRDGAAILGETELVITAEEDAEVVLVETVFSAD